MKLDFKGKQLLFSGIVLLVSGISIRVLWGSSYAALFFIISGVICKLTYLIRAVKNDGYKPGIEFLILLAGLLMFFSGIAVKNAGCDIDYKLFMYPGIVLKVTFIVFFIVKSKRKLSR